MKTYTTDEMIIVLSKIDFDITFLLEENRDVHVFNDVYRNICKGEYGSGALPFLLNHLSQIMVCHTVYMGSIN